MQWAIDRYEQDRAGFIQPTVSKEVVKLSDKVF